MTDDTAGYARLLARAAARSGAAQWAAATELWEQVTERNPVNGDNWIRLAEARFALNDYPAAVRAYGRVAELGVRPRRGPGAAFSEDLPYPSPAEVAYRVACCHAGLGDRERAVDALGEALTAGFRDLDRAREDELWESLREESRVREMLGIVDTAGMSREEGWRADLRLLAREIKRRAYAPFAVISEEDFDRAVGDLHGRIPGMSDAQIMIGMMKLLRPLGDGHAFINAPSDDEKLAAALPVEFYLFTEGVFVTAAGEACHRLLGARVDKIGGHPIAEVMAALDPVISRDNDQQVAFIAVALLRRVPFLHALGLTGEPGKAALAVRFPDGSSEDITVDAAPSKPGGTYPYPRGWVALHDTMAAPPPLHLRNRDLAYWFSYLPAEELVYFQFNGIEDHPAEPFAAFCDRLFAFIDSHRSARLVIDVRRQHVPHPAIAAPPDQQPGDQPARFAVRHHRPPDVLGRPEHRHRDRARDTRHIRRRANRIAPQLHRGDYPLRTAVQQGHRQCRRPVLANLLAHGLPAVDRAGPVRAAHVRGLQPEPGPSHGSHPCQSRSPARQLSQDTLARRRARLACPGRSAVPVAAAQAAVNP